MARTAGLSTHEILDLLQDLAERLTDACVTARIYLIGGAAAALRYYPDGHERSLTDDIDAVVFCAGDEAREVLWRLVEEIARERELDPSWFNNKAAKFVSPVGTPDGDTVFTHGTVTVQVAPARLLLAMKLRACRLGRDDEDIAVLLRHCALTTMAEADTLVSEVYDGEEQIPPTRRAVVEACFGEYELVRANPQVRLPPITY